MMEFRKTNLAQYQNREIFEVTPIKLGGSPTDPKNKIALTREQHVEAVNYWNRVIKDMSNSQKIQNVLVTGGAGYIGAHTVRQLLAAGLGVVVIDDLSTGNEANLSSEAKFINGDFADKALLKEIFETHKIDSVMHFAASIEVGESVEKPLEYLENNTLKTASLLQTMLENDVTRFIFSSTAAVYGLQEKVPIPEDAPLGPLDPYGSSKLLTEKLIEYYTRFAGLQAIIFRYFNACGADHEKPIHDSHLSHLIPRLVESTEGRMPMLEILGDDYNTPDGTGVRDYVHVLDVARAHVMALEHLDKAKCEIMNIGTGQGLSVKEIIRAAEKLTGKKVPYKISKRRPGDSPITVADNSKIKEKIGFEPKHSDLDTIIKTSWH